MLKRIFRFYYQGFRDMPKWGKQIWLILLIKLFVIFVLVKFIFFPNFLKTNFSTDKERSDYVFNELINKSENDSITVKH
ncbi:MAG: DUF4492 domain-containing protein [Bacteroidales bacterium]|jgi:hypothetical protein|nr:DUF4492 domain-containing protein [Bacteroidales bacterium]NLB85525.1 DUF4492 domain-containing protein [Bacteroidales bacterium]